MRLSLGFFVGGDAASDLSLVIGNLEVKQRRASGRDIAVAHRLEVAVETFVLTYHQLGPQGTCDHCSVSTCAFTTIL